MRARLDLLSAAAAAAAAVALPSPTDPFNIPGTEVRYSTCHTTNTCAGARTSALTVCRYPSIMGSPLATVAAAALGAAHYTNPYRSMLSRGDGNPQAGRCLILNDGCHYKYVPAVGCIRYWRDVSTGEHKVPATGQAVSPVIFFLWSGTLP
ncbi:MAG: hypothetical protein M1826_001748 [Phylliscum demangeonii]|nr:MAG: hypothetical protein M1826_001748 [Phylliscum demangeonii]